MGMAGLNLEPHLPKSGKSVLFYSCTSDVIVISKNSQWAKSCKNTQKPSSPGIQRFLPEYIPHSFRPYEKHFHVSNIMEICALPLIKVQERLTERSIALRQNMFSLKSPSQCP